MADKVLGPRELREALSAVGLALAARGQRYEIVIVGGSALALRGIVDRPTRDVDVVGLREGDRVVPAAQLPEPLAIAVADIARVLDLPPDWINVGPRSLLEFGPPEGFVDRLTALRFDGLIVHVAGRRDQIAFKLYATIDQGPESRHYADLRALAPTNAELLDAARWTTTQDPSPGFRSGLMAALRALGVTDADL